MFRPFTAFHGFVSAVRLGEAVCFKLFCPAAGGTSLQSCSFLASHINKICQQEAPNTEFLIVAADLHRAGHSAEAFRLWSSTSSSAAIHHHLPPADPDQPCRPHEPLSTHDRWWCDCHVCHDLTPPAVAHDSCAHLRLISPLSAVSDEAMSTPSTTTAVATVIKCSPLTASMGSSTATASVTATADAHANATEEATTTAARGVTLAGLGNRKPLPAARFRC